MDLFTVDLALKVGFEILKRKVGGKLGAFLFGGPIGFIASFFLSKYLNLWIEAGVIRIDIVIEKARMYLTEEEFTKFAKKSYDKVTKRVYNESEKENIRQDYLRAIRKFGPISGRLR